MADRKGLPQDSLRLLNYAGQRGDCSTGGTWGVQDGDTPSLLKEQGPLVTAVVSSTDMPALLLLRCPDAAHPRLSGCGRGSC